MRKTTLLLLLFALPFTINAQDAKKQAEIEQKLLKEVVKQDGRFTITYDKFKDFTSLRSGWNDLHSVADIRSTTNTFLNCHFVGEGVKGQPEECYMFISSRSRSWTFLRYHDVTMLIDDKRQQFEGVTHDGDLESRPSVGVVERIVVPMTPEVIDRIATGRIVQMKIGSYEFFFTLGNLADFKAMTKRLADAPKQ